MSALDKQVKGNHYKNFTIQPIEFITKNNLGFIEGNVVKYICRHQFKDQVNDVDKVIHYCELLKELLKELTYGMKQNQLQEVVTSVATGEENSASALAELVANHPVKHLVLKRIVNILIGQGAHAVKEMENAINEAVVNNGNVDRVECLDILLRE